MGEVRDPPLAWPLGGELPIEKVGSDGRRSGAVVFWKTPTSWASAQGVRPHQALDFVQAAGETFGKHVPPDAARAISASAPYEAPADLDG
jgi:hypothetical protein